MWLKVFSHFGELRSAVETGADRGTKKAVVVVEQNLLSWGQGAQKFDSSNLGLSVGDAINTSHELHLKKNCTK